MHYSILDTFGFPAQQFLKTLVYLLSNLK